MVYARLWRFMEVGQRFFQLILPFRCSAARCFVQAPWRLRSPTKRWNPGRSITWSPRDLSTGKACTSPMDAVICRHMLPSFWKTLCMGRCKMLQVVFSCTWCSRPVWLQPGMTLTQKNCYRNWWVLPELGSLGVLSFLVARRRKHQVWININCWPL